MKPSPQFWDITNLFYDKGNGFNPFDSLRSIIPHDVDGQLQIDEHYRLPASHVKGLLFCPCQGAPSRCRIDTVETDGNCLKVVPIDSQPHEGADYFANGEALYELQGDFAKATYVHIRGWIDIDCPAKPF